MAIVQRAGAESRTSNVLERGNYFRAEVWNLLRDVLASPLVMEVKWSLGNIIILMYLPFRHPMSSNTPEFVYIWISWQSITCKHDKNREKSFKMLLFEKEREPLIEYYTVWEHWLADYYYLEEMP